MIKISTSLEQSKKLVELGLDTNTANMCYKCLGEDPYDLIVHPYSDWKEEYKGLLISKEANVIPAWSTTALMNLLPSDFTIKGELGEFTYEIDIRKYRFDAETEVYQIAYGSYGNNMSWHDMISTAEHENLLDACIDMICWLLENKKI